MSLRGQSVGRGIDLGGQIGVAHYKGDASKGLLPLRLSPQIGISAYYRSQLRLTYFAELDYKQLRGDTRDEAILYPRGDVAFESYNLGLLLGAEYNWSRHSLGYHYLDTKRWTPFVGIGLGLMLSWNEKTLVSPQLGLRMGVKYILNERIRLRLQYSWQYSTSDQLDALGKSASLASPIGLDSKSLRHGDSYGALTLGIAYTLGIKDKNCD